MVLNLLATGLSTPVHWKGTSDGYGLVALGGAAQYLYLAMLHRDDVSTSEPYVLVELADSTNYPHTSTNKIFLKKLILDGEVKSDGQFNFKIGVVKEADATDGSVQWIWTFNLETVDNPTDSTHRFHREVDFCQGGDPRGIDLTVSGGALSYVITNDSQNNHVNWQSDGNLTSPEGSSTPGAGDLVGLVEEPAGAGTMSFTLAVLYSTE